MAWRLVVFSLTLRANFTTSLRSSEETGLIFIFLHYMPDGQTMQTSCCSPERVKRSRTVSRLARDGRIKRTKSSWEMEKSGPWERKLMEQLWQQHLWGHVFIFPSKGNKCSSHKVQTAADHRVKPPNRQVSCVLGWQIPFQVNPQVELSRDRCVIKLKNGIDFFFNWI